MKPYWVTSSVFANSRLVEGSTPLGGINRRDFLFIGAGAAANLLCAQTQISKPANGENTTEAFFPMPDQNIIRPDDLLVIHFHFENLSLLRTYGMPDRLVRTAVNQPCLIVMILPPNIFRKKFLLFLAILSSLSHQKRPLLTGAKLPFS